MVKTSLTYSDYIKGIEHLVSEEQLSLIEIISSRMKRSLLEEKIKHSILNSKDWGLDIWTGIDAQEYVRKERNSGIN